ncbi:MAG: hypothetical protein QM811_00610 [Pirellulales bacterium]
MATDPLNPPVKPAPAGDPNDPFATPKPEMPVKPEMPEKPAVDPLDPLATPVVPENPVKPAVPAVDPLDPLATDPLNPPPVKPAPTVDPNDPFALPKPEMPAKPEVPAVDPAPAAPPAPIMLVDATFTAEELDAALKDSTETLTFLVANPTDGKAKFGAYRNLSRVGEIAGKLKGTPEELTARVSAAGKAFDELKKHGETAKELGALAGLWLAAKPEKRNNGILAYGVPGEAAAIGTLFRTTLSVPGPNGEPLRKTSS